MKERRCYCRIPFSAVVEVSWNADGERRQLRGKYIDISVGGLGVQVPEPIPVSTWVTLSVEEIGFSGSAVVRHTVPSGSAFLIGLELTPETREQVFGAQLNSVTSSGEYRTKH